MSAKTITAGVIGSALLATVAFAQTPSTTVDHTNMAPGASTAATTASTSSYQGDWRTSKVVGLNVYNNNNESVGTINDLLTDKNGNIKAVVLGVGGLLGVGEHLVAVNFDQIKFVDTPVPSSTTSSNTPPSPGNPPASSTTTTGSTASSSMTTTKSSPWYPDHAVYNVTKDQLKSMPEFTYSN
jgi:sporulation protein YlmC with PRC-barrel domain